MKSKDAGLEKNEILQKVKRGLADVSAGRTKDQADVKEALAQPLPGEGHERGRSRQSWGRSRQSWGGLSRSHLLDFDISLNNLFNWPEMFLSITVCSSRVSQ